MKHAIYARIDERLIHGQVSLRWKQAYDVTRYIVVDDSSAQDTFRQKLLTANDDTPTDFVTVDQAVQIIPEYKEDVLLIIAARPQEILELVNQGVEIPLCNIGNMHMDVDRVQIGTSVAVDASEKQALIQLHEKGVQLEMRPYPHSEPESLDALWEETK